ncbi:MAG: hypothetical protein C0425_07885 [Chlorobiaceae bacterium]|nr:hypothetical protein [Chlorobiaceae bacterium]MBA4310241.1 hypothetical protein [Chlorobiaceae bacterium]
MQFFLEEPIRSKRFFLFHFRETVAALLQNDNRQFYFYPRLSAFYQRHPRSIVFCWDCCDDWEDGLKVLFEAKRLREQLQFFLEEPIRSKRFFLFHFRETVAALL